MGAKVDPLVGFHFSIDFAGAAVGFFSEVSGIGSENEVIDNKIMGPDGHKEQIQKIPGRLKWENIVAKRGITAAMDMWNWRKQVEDGNVTAARKNGAVSMYDESGKLVAQWTFDNGWPVKVTGPSVKADANEIGVEEITVTHEGIRRVM